MTTSPDRCPRCGQTNECAVAAGAASCWCFTLPPVAGPSRPAAGERPAAASGDQACLCRRCLMGAAGGPRHLQWSERELSVKLGMDVAGAGPSVLLLPALSSIATRGEMRGLLEQLSSHFLVRSVDWPGFGDQPRPRADWSPTLLSAYLEWLLNELTPPHALIAAGHAAGYALQLCARRPGLIRRLVLIAPTWRGPLPTMMGGQRAWFARVRRLFDHPVLGPGLYRLNVSRAVIGLMAREHVYEAPGWLQGPRLAEKLAVTRAVGARYASVRFVSGALDPVASRAVFLELARRAAVPILQVYGARTPPRSCAEMQALAQLPEVQSVCLPHGRLAVHEEFPEQVAAAVLPFLQHGME